MNDLIAGRYQVMDFLGAAAFSRAVQALDVKTNMLVCLKIVKVCLCGRLGGVRLGIYDASLHSLEVIQGNLSFACLPHIFSCHPLQNNKDYFDQSLDEIKLLKYVNSMDPNDEQGVVRLYDYFYHKVTTPVG